MDSLCDNDKALGPSVRGCRGGFDFTSKFEHIFLALIPSAVFITLSIARVAFLTQRKKIVNAVWWQLLKLVCLENYQPHM